MALPTSGPLSISMIKAELGSSSNSLRTLSSLVGFSTPDAISEFYGYNTSTGTAYGYTVALNNDSVNVCSTISTFVYSSSSAFGPGITLYYEASLTTLIQTYSYVVESGAIYELNSTTGVVGFFVGYC